MFGVDEGGDASGLLRLCQGMEGQSGFSGGFGAVDFDDAAFGVASSQGDVCVAGKREG